MKRKASKQGLTHAGAAVVIVILLIGAYFGYQQGYFGGHTETTQLGGGVSTSITTAQGGNGNYGDISLLQHIQTDGSISGPSWNRYLAATSFTAPFDSPGSGAPVDGDSYCGSIGGSSGCGPQSISNTLPSSGWFEQISATHVYQEAFNTATVCGGLSLATHCTYAPSGYPGFSYSLNGATSGQYSYYTIQAVVPVAPTAMSATLAAVGTTNVTLINGFSGSVMPSGNAPFTLQIKSDPTGIPTDACVSNSILGTTSSPVTDYSQPSSPQVTNNVVNAYCLVAVITNQSSTIGVTSGGNYIGTPLVSTVAGMSAALIQVTNSQTGTNGNQGITNTVGFTVSTSGSKHIFVGVVVFDEQQSQYIMAHITNQFTGTFNCATSGTFCGNQTAFQSTGAAGDNVVRQFSGMPSGWNFGNWQTTTSAPNNGWVTPIVIAGAGEILLQPSGTASGGN